MSQTVRQRRTLESCTSVHRDEPVPNRSFASKSQRIAVVALDSRGRIYRTRPACPWLGNYCHSVARTPHNQIHSNLCEQQPAEPTTRGCVLCVGRRSSSPSVESTPPPDQAIARPQRP